MINDVDCTVPRSFRLTLFHSSRSENDIYTYCRCDWGQQGHRYDGVLKFYDLEPNPWTRYNIVKDPL
jgi:hypothetical protein